MTDSIDLIVKLIPLFPLLAVILNGLFGRRYSHDLAHRFAWGSVGLSFLCTIGVFTDILEPDAAHEVIAYQWIFGGDLTINLAYLDRSSDLHHAAGRHGSRVPDSRVLRRVHAWGSGLHAILRVYEPLHGLDVAARHGQQLCGALIGWEGVGLCSYLLIGYYYDKVSAAKAATKAFVVNRIGDAGFLLAIFLVFVNFKTLDYTKVLQNAAQLSPEMATAIALCLLVGAVGKSAQIPLYTWLPDAMEGPTPVSALIHAATMVTAGVYMIVAEPCHFRSVAVAMTTVA